jgi:ATP-binding cassette subfamily C protein
MALFDVLIHAVMLMVIFITILVIDFTASLTAVVIFGGLYGLLMLYFHQRLKKAGNKRLESNKIRYKLTQEALTSIKMTKVLGNESYYLNEFEDSSYQFAKQNAYARVVSTFPRYVIEGVAFGGLMLFVVVQLSLGRNLESLVPIVGVLGLAGYRMLPSLQTVFQRYSSFMYYIPILNKLVSELSEESEYEDLEDQSTKESFAFHQAIKLQAIFFQYNEDEHFSLQNIHLEIKKNQVVGFMGETGSGKSTLIDILMGLLKPEKGSLLLDDILITKDNTRSYQKLLGYVPQDIFLSDDSLLKNIAFGMKDDAIDFEKVKKAAKIAAIDAFIENELPSGYDTLVGERGVRLSGGQRQRIGIARALYRDPEIIVFDEATSALDNKTEKEVLKAINNAAKNRTVIMIAHRLNTLKNCDVIFKLDHGKLIKQGSYKEMVED